jgi:DNA-directed RNA polymerase specialized sigma24 family protein
MAQERAAIGSGQVDVPQLADRIESTLSAALGDLWRTDPERAEEILQRTTIRFLDDMRGRKPLSDEETDSLARRLVRSERSRVSRDRARIRRSLSRRTAQVRGLYIDQPVASADEADRARAQHRLAEAIESLSTQQRDVVRLFLGGDSIRDIASALGRTANVIQTLLERTFADLRTALNAAGLELADFV